MSLIQREMSIKVVLITIFISFSIPFYANSHIVTKTYFEHLSEVNKEWLNHKDVCPTGFISFRSDLDKIQLHLNLVIEYLKSNRPSNLSSKQLSIRVFLLEKLQEYTDHKIFPVNKYHLTRQPYFVDDYGTNCAVGQMIFDSGHEQLVAKISKEHNYDYIVDIHTDGLMEWANEFGFTLEELKWIQPTYPPSTTIEQVMDGTNGTVTKIINNNYTGGLIIAGDFTELDSFPCLNIGVYKNNQLSCLGNGIDGIINDVIVTGQSGDIYAFGELQYNGQQFPIAKFDGSNWSYIGISGRDGAVATAANVGGSGYQYEVAISHSSIPQHQEIWHLLNNNTWKKQAMVKGVVLDIIASGYGRVHVGHFDSVTVYTTNEMIDTALVVTNVVIHLNYSNKWYGIGSNISDTVNVVTDVGNALIFGGTCKSLPGESNVCLSRYFNSVLQPLMINYKDLEDNTDPEDFSVKAIAYRSGNTFTFGGFFDMQPFSVGTYGRHLATYDLVSNIINPIAAFDQGVNSLAFLNGELYIGGEFQSNLGVQNIHYLGRTVSTVGVKELNFDIKLNVYPNPFQTTIQIEGLEDGVIYSVLFLDGRIAKNGTVFNEKINNLDSLPKGTYLLQLETSKGSVVKKISKL